MTKFLSGPAYINKTTLKTISPLSAQISTTRFLQTEVEKKLEDFLKDEIVLEEGEKKTFGKKVGNFNVAKTEGPNVELMRTVDGQTVRVKFSVNNSVSDMHEEEDETNENQQAENEEPFMPVSRPNFVVEIDKGAGEVLAIQCVPGIQTAHETPEDAQDSFEIQEVTLLKGGEEWSDDTYSLSSMIMDGDMYDRLMDLLAEKGVDDDFSQSLIEWSTTYEHHSYINLLNSIKSFAAK